MAKMASLVEPAWSKKVITVALCMGVAGAFPSASKRRFQQGTREMAIDEGPIGWAASFMSDRTVQMTID